MKTIRQIYIRGVDRTGDVAAIAEVKNAYRIQFQNSPKTYFYPKKQIRLLERSPHSVKLGLKSFPTSRIFASMQPNMSRAPRAAQPGRWRDEI